MEQRTKDDRIGLHAFQKNHTRCLSVPTCVYVQAPKVCRADTVVWFRIAHGVVLFARCIATST
jgi:hypothetical protein